VTPSAIRSPLADCVLIENWTTRFLSGSDHCYEVRYSFFADLDAGSDLGGAIYQSAGKSPVFVFDSLFLRCSASLGGAIGCYGASLEAARCCFEDCQADAGIAVDIAYVDSAMSLGTSNIFDCHRRGLGSINLQAVTGLSLSLVNISDTIRPGTPGTAIQSDGVENGFEILYSSLVTCDGLSLISGSFDGDHPALEFCNLYNNTATDSLVIITGWAPRFDHCIFAGNVCPRYLAGGSGSASGYVLTNCVFDVNLPADDTLASSANVVYNAVTASWSLAHLESCYDAGQEATAPASSVPPSETPTAVFTAYWAPTGGVWGCFSDAFYLCFRWLPGKMDCDFAVTPEVLNRIA
jgi:hypothetical protein